MPRFTIPSPSPAMHEIMRVAVSREREAVKWLGIGNRKKAEMLFDAADTLFRSAMVQRKEDDRYDRRPRRR